MITKLEHYRCMLDDDDQHRVKRLKTKSLKTMKFIKFKNYNFNWISNFASL